MRDCFDTIVVLMYHLTKSFVLFHKHSSSIVRVIDIEIGSMYTEMNLVRITVFRKPTICTIRLQ